VEPWVSRLETEAGGKVLLEEHGYGNNGARLKRKVPQRKSRARQEILASPLRAHGLDFPKQCQVFFWNPVSTAKKNATITMN
jgi:hypothetical protein